MQTGQHSGHSHHGCGQSRGPEIFYGYCHQTNRMRMMDYTDYMSNVQTGYSNLVNNPSSSIQAMMDALANMMRNPAVPPTASPHHKHHRHGCRCGCEEQDCACSCCIRCADVIEYARCTEARV